MNAASPMRDVTSMTVAVVICAYTMDRWDQLCAAVSSVQGQTRPADQLVLVIDHEDELHARAVLTWAGQATVVASSQPRGLSGARNAGVAAASADVVAFLDDDAVAAPEWLASMLASYRDEHVLGVGGTVVPEWEASRPPWFPAEFDWVVGCSYTGLRTSPGPIRNPIGANMSFLREAIVDSGGFSTRVGRVGTKPVGCEETELALRIAGRHPSGCIVQEPGAVVRHHVPRERASWRYFRQRCWAEGRSKAVVRRLVGDQAALGTERTYVTRALPRGCLAGLRDSLTGAHPGGAQRSLAIVGGLAITVAGYTSGRLVREDQVS